MLFIMILFVGSLFRTLWFLYVSFAIDYIHLLYLWMTLPSTLDPLEENLNDLRKYEWLFSGLREKWGINNNIAGTQMKLLN